MSVGAQRLLMHRGGEHYGHLELLERTMDKLKKNPLELATPRTLAYTHLPAQEVPGRKFYALYKHHQTPCSSTFLSSLIVGRV